MKDHAKIYHELKSLLANINEGIGKPMELFMEMNQTIHSNGALSSKTKTLIGLGIAVQTHCSECLTWHMKQCIDLGIKDEEIMETLSVAILMGGGPSVMYACQAYAALKQLRSDSGEYKDDMYL